MEIDRLDAAHHGIDDLLPAFGELEGDPAAVAGIGAPGEMTVKKLDYPVTGDEGPAVSGYLEECRYSQVA